MGPAPIKVQEINYLPLHEMLRSLEIQMAEEFKVELKKWRGKRRQKTVSDLLEVSVRTYQGWESGACQPALWKCMACVRRKMSENEITR